MIFLVGFRVCFRLLGLQGGQQWQASKPPHKDPSWSSSASSIWRCAGQSRREDSEFFNLRFYYDSFQQVRVLLGFDHWCPTSTPIRIKEFNFHLSRVKIGYTCIWPTDPLRWCAARSSVYIYSWRQYHPLWSIHGRVTWPINDCNKPQASRQAAHCQHIIDT
jgi:hypothetical protein